LRTQSAECMQESRYAWSRGQAGGLPRTTACQRIGEQKKKKKKKKTLPTRTMANFLSRAIVAQLPHATPRRYLKSRIGVNLQKEQDKDERTKMVKEYLTNSVLLRDRAKADWVVTMSNHCLLVVNVLWYKTKTKTRITMAVWAPLALHQVVMEAAQASRNGGHRGETMTIDRVRLGYY
jgi:hypothetical protein